MSALPRMAARPAGAPEGAPIFGGGPPCTLDSARAYCETLPRGRFEGFPGTSRFVAPREREQAQAVYAFAWTAWEVATAPRYEGRREAALADLEAQLERAVRGEAEHPVLVALRDALRRSDLPAAALRDLVTACDIDAGTRRHPSWASLERFLRYKAQPLGRLLLYVFNYRDPALIHCADDLALGFGLISLLREAGADLRRDRLYLPEEDLRHFGVAEAALRHPAPTQAERDLVRFQVARARSFLERGRPLIDRVGRELGYELALSYQQAVATLYKIEALGYDVFRRRPQLTPADRARVMARAATQRWPRWSLSPARWTNPPPASSAAPRATVAS